MPAITNKNENLYDVIIIGGGPAGLTAAIYLARAAYRVLVIEKESFGGQITITEEIVNYPGVIRCSGEELTARMKQQGENFGAEYLLDEVLNIDTQGDIKTVRTSTGEFLCFGILIATGAHPRVLGFEGEEQFKGRGVAYCATCDGEFFKGREVFVVGGGYAAAQESVFLTKYARQVTILIREEDFTCAKAVADKARSNEKIRVLTQVVVERVEGDEALTSITYRNLRTNETVTYHAPIGERIGVFVFAGYEPATKLVRDIVELSEQGYVVTDRNQQTTIDGLYAAGDICVKSLRQVVTAVGDGALAATELERYASKMQQKTGLIPEKADAGHAVQSPAQTQKTSVEASELFAADIDAKLREIFEKMEHPMILELFLEENVLSRELNDYMTHLAHMTDKLELKYNAVHEMEELPCVRICRKDGIWTGLAFHGVPGGHEFSSFLMGLYHAASNQVLPEQERIMRISVPVHIRVMVTLSCNMCPDVVVAAQQMAAANANITADIYDIAQYPALQEKYRIMSVPCIVINDGTPHFGRKDSGELLALVEAAAAESVV